MAGTRSGDLNRLRVALAAIALVAGVLVAGVSSGVPAASASADVELFACGLNGPFGMDFDTAGNLYVANEGDGGGGESVSEISTTGEVSFFATGLFGPSGVEFDDSETLYVSDDTDSVFAVSATGALTPFLTGIGLGNPNAIGFDADDGGLYVAHSGIVDKFDTAGVSVLTSVGNFNTNQSIAVDDANDLVYTSDFDGNLYAVDQATGATSTVLAGLGFTEGGLTIDSDGFIYYSAWSAGEVLKIDPSDWSVSTFVDGLTTPRGLRFDATGNLFITSYETGTIYRSTSAGGTAPPYSTIAGSLTSDWVNGNGWTGDGTVTIDIDGGTHVFPGVPVDGDGSFYFETGLDLNVGTGIVVTDDTTFASKDVILADLTFHTLDAGSNTASGTAPVGAEVHVEVGNESGGAGLVVIADGSGDWTADFTTVGFVVTDETGGGAQIFDASCDSSLADSPPPKTITASLTSDWVDAWGFTADASVSFEIYDAEGGTSLFGPESRPTDGEGHYFLEPQETGVDLMPGMYLTVTDDVTGQVKDLTLADLTLDSVDYDTNIVTGTAPAEAFLQVGAGNETIGCGIEVQADLDGDWSADFTDAECFYNATGDPAPPDLTEDMGVSAQLFDDDDDATLAEPTQPPPPPYFNASLTSDWVDAWGFTADASVSFEIYDAEGGTSLFGPESRPTDGEGHYFLEPQETGVDLMPGMYLTVTDDVTGQVKDLTLADLTLDSVDYDTNIVTGTAPAEAFLQVGAGNETIGCGIEVQADLDGDWSADFTDAECFYNATGDPAPPDLTEDMGVSAQLFDDDDDATLAEPTQPPPPPYFNASLTSDWVDAWGFTADASVSFEIYDAEGGTSLFGPESRPTDGEGHYFLEPQETGVDLMPGMYLTVTDDVTGQVKDLTLADLTLDSVDYDTNIVTGTAPAEAFLQVGAGNETIGCGIEVQADLDGDWSADFTDAECFYNATGDPAPSDLTEDMGVSAQLFDDDDDATVAEPGEAPPEEGISNAFVNVSNFVTGLETGGYAFEVFITAYGDFGATTSDAVVLTVNGVELDLDDAIEFLPTDDGSWSFRVSGMYPGTPSMGVYAVEVTDGAGTTWGFEIGELEDIPEDAPHMVFPTHLALTTDKMPTISWESFESDYLGSKVPPENYELNLAPSGDEEISYVFPIDPGTTSIVYSDPNWEEQPLPVDGLEPGVYNVTVHSNHSVAPGFSFEHHRNLSFVVYDPTGGFVTGGGWIDSPDGAYDADPGLTGKVTFGFVSKYKKGATVPTGSTEFQFRLADLNFHSNDYQWLAVGGSTATYAGTGTINGSGNYSFMLRACDVTAIDDCQAQGEDTFRIQIWDDDNGGYTVYDNGGTPLGGGNIKIHKKNGGPS